MASRRSAVKGEHTGSGLMLLKFAGQFLSWRYYQNIYYVSDS